MLTTKPTPHESCSFSGSYRACLITSCIATTFLGVTYQRTRCTIFAQVTMLPVGWANGNDPAASQRRLISRRTASEQERKVEPQPRLSGITGACQDRISTTGERSNDHPIWDGKSQRGQGLHSAGGTRAALYGRAGRRLPGEEVRRRVPEPEPEREGAGDRRSGRTRRQALYLLRIGRDPTLSGGKDRQ